MNRALALGLFLESGVAFLIALGQSQQASVVRYNLGIASIEEIQRFLLFAPPCLLAVGAISLLVRWKPGWWLAFAVELQFLLNLGGTVLVFGRLMQGDSGLGATDPRGWIGVGLLGLSGLLWHLLLVLGLLRGDVRGSMGLSEVEPWGAAGKAALAVTAALLVVFGLRLGAGW